MQSFKQGKKYFKTVNPKYKRLANQQKGLDKETHQIFYEIY